MVLQWPINCDFRQRKTSRDCDGWILMGDVFLNTKHIQRICTLLGRKCWSIPSPKCQRSFSEQPGFFQFSLHGYAKDAGAGSQGSIARGCFFASWKPWAIHSKTYFAYEKYAPFNHSHVELPEGMFEDSIPPTKTTLRGRQLTLSWKTLWLSWSKCFWDMVHVHTFAKIHQIHGIYIYYIYDNVCVLNMFSIDSCCVPYFPRCQRKISAGHVRVSSTLHMQTLQPVQLEVTLW